MSQASLGFGFVCERLSSSARRPIGENSRRLAPPVRINGSHDRLSRLGAARQGPQLPVSLPGPRLRLYGRGGLLGALLLPYECGKARLGRRARRHAAAVRRGSGTARAWRVGCLVLCERRPLRIAGPRGSRDDSINGGINVNFNANGGANSGCRNVGRAVCPGRGHAPLSGTRSVVAAPQSRTAGSSCDAARARASRRTMAAGFFRSRHSCRPRARLAAPQGRHLVRF